MQNIKVIKNEMIPDLDKSARLFDGSLVLIKYKGFVTGALIVVPFRDHKNRYRGDDISRYCSLINLDDGKILFEQRCSRYTTVRRILNHVLKLGKNNYEYNQSIPAATYVGCDIEIIPNGKYEINISY